MTRTRTAPEVKWVANEMAAVRGELVRIEGSMARLVQRRSKLQEDLAALELVAAQLASVPPVARDATVRGHGRYGGRGALRGWLRQVLQQAYPRALDSLSLAEQAITVFGLQFTSTRERYRFTTDHLGSALRKLVEYGEVERIHDVSRPTNRIGVWRWKMPDCSLDALRERHAAR